MTATDGARVHDLGAERRAELLAELFRGSSERGHLRDDSTLRGALAATDYLDHVLGRARLGAVPFIDAERVTWACIDLDVRNWGHDPNDSEALAMVAAIVEALALRGLRAVPERSRGKGWHVWVFLDALARARDVRALLRSIALEAGARDDADLVCPRQDRIDDVGNGTYLPLCGLDRAPLTRFHQWNEDGDLLPIEDAELAAFLRDLAEHRSPASRVPTADGPRDREPEGDGGHPCAWILDELTELGLRLEAAVFLDGGNPDRARIMCACPLHDAPHKRTRGGSAVFWADGRGRCSSAKCGKTWRTVAQFVELAGGRIKRPEPPADLDAYAYTGPRLVALRALPDPLLVRPYLPPGLLGLVVLAGSPKAGKTTLALELALQGALAEDGMPAMRSLVVCAERPAKQLDAVLRRLDTSADRTRTREEWTRRIAIAARGPECPPRMAELLTLDTTGRAALVALLRAARASGDPFGLLMLDSLSRLKPPELDEDSASDMTPWMGELHRVAHEEQTCVILVHHARKGRAGALEGDPFDAIRGAGAILAVADVALVLRRPAGTEGERYRELLARGNCVPDWRGTFETCTPPDHSPGTLYRWRPIDRAAAPDLETILSIGEEMTRAALWRRATDAPEGERPGEAGYARVRAWVAAWGVRVETYPGARSAEMVRRVS